MSLSVFLTHYAANIVQLANLNLGYQKLVSSNHQVHA